MSMRLCRTLNDERATYRLSAIGYRLSAIFELADVYFCNVDYVLFVYNHVGAYPLKRET
jgi:hypothetical protein